MLDLDGVLRGFHRTDHIERAHDLLPGTVAATALRPDLFDPAMTGVITHEHWLDAVIDALVVEEGMPIEGATAVVRAWSAAGFVLPAAVALVRTVRERCRVAVLTNATTRLTTELAMLGLDRELDGVVSSAEIGFGKPHPEAYLAALALLDGVASETLFCDDNEVNVTGAAAVGLMSAHVPDTDALRSVLAGHGLLD